MKTYNNIGQNTLDWFYIRKGKITGTTLKALRGTPRARQEAIYELIAERLTEGVSDERENSAERGKRLEAEALAAFEFKTGKTVTRMGFCESDESQFIANSPDGLIGEEGNYTEAVEIKCFEGKNYVKTWINNQILDEYEDQVIQYFVVNENLETLYFVAYNPEIPIHPIHIIEVKREGLLTVIEQARQDQLKVLEEIKEKLSTIVEF